MKECWRDGDLRAYLDGELSPSEMQRVAAHLAECHKCEARYDEVAGRAGLVTGLMESLTEMEPAVSIRMPLPVRRWRQWAGAGAAIAAGIAIAAMLIPKSSGPAAALAPESAITAAPPERAAAPEAPVVSEVGTAPSRARLAGSRVALPPRRRQLPRDVFLALDDEPIETGLVVRMTLGEEEIPADVVFGKDGRARAVRLIGTQPIH